MAEGIQIGEAYVRIRPDTKGFQGEAEQSLNGIASGLKTAFGALAGAAVFKSGLDELKQQEAVAAQTAAALKSTAGAANVTAKEIANLAEEVQGYSGKDKEAIQAGENLLLTFTKVRNEAGQGNDVFTQATKIVADLSVAFGKDLTTSAILVGKALQDPISGVTALRKVGVQLSEQQKASIKSFVEQGDIMSAQKVILQELTTQVGGSAAAYGNTLPGQLEKAKNEFDDLAAVVIGGVVPALTGVLGVVQPMAEGFASLPVPVRDTALALAALALVAKKLEIPNIGALRESLQGTAGIAVGVGAGIGVALFALGELNKKFAEATKAGKEFAQSQEKKIPTQSYDELRAAYGRTVAGVDELSRTIANSKAPWDKDYRIEVSNYRQQLEGLATTQAEQINLIDAFARAAGIGGPQAKAYFDALTGAGIPIRNSAEALYFFQQNSDGAAIAAQHTAEEVDTSADAFKKYGDDVSGVFDSLTKVESSNEAVYDAQRKVADSSKEAASASRDQASAQLDLADAQERLNDLQNQGAKNNRDQRGAALDVRQATLDLKDAQEEAAKAPGDERAQLRAEQAQLRLEEAQQKVADVEQGIADQSGEIARARLEVAGAESALADARDRVSQLPHERAQAEQELTNALISQQLALIGVRTQLDGTPGAIQEAITYIDALAASGAISTDQANAQKDALFAMKGVTDTLPAEISMPVSAPGAAETSGQINALADSYIKVGDSLIYVNAAGKGIGIKGQFIGQDIDVATAQGLRPKAIGGNVAAGVGYRVNELGKPELFTDTAGNQYMMPTTAGHVTNIGDAPSKRSFGDVHVTINTTNGQSLSGFTRELDRAAFLMGA